MKKCIAILTVAVFAAVAYAGDKTGANKNKTASADKAVCTEKASSACPTTAEAASCCPNGKVAKKDSTKKIVQSPKAAGEAGR